MFNHLIFFLISPNLTKCKGPIFSSSVYPNKRIQPIKTKTYSQKELEVSSSNLSNNHFLSCLFGKKTKNL